jgi:rubrerythrin
MGTAYNADEVLSMAIKIEENGAAFYRRAAQLQMSDEESKELLSLASMEDDHKRKFQQMQRSLPDRGAEGAPFDPYEEADLYLFAVSDAHGGEGAPDAADALTGTETIEEVLWTAVGLEKQSILFYVGLRDRIAPEDRETLDSVIAEEKRHVADLSRMIKAQKKG